MASWYSRSDSPYLWVKYWDSEVGKYVYESTNRFIRPSNGKTTACYKGTKEGEKLAKQICEEIDAALTLDLKIPRFVIAKSNTPIEEAYHHFKSINKNKNISTQKNYELFYNLFTKSFPPHNKCSTIDKLSVELWLASLVDMKTSRGKYYSQNYRYNFQKNLKKFLYFLFDNGYLTETFRISKDVQVSIEIGKKIIFKPEHIHLIFDNLKDKGNNFRTCIYLLAYSGLRSTDILSIRAELIDLKGKTFQYLSPKLKKYIIIPIHSKLLPVLKERLLEIKEGPIIEYSHHHAVRIALKRYLDSLSIGCFGYSPRTFRKSFDTWAYQAGMNTVANSRLVGHSITTAERNYREVYMEDLRKELNKFSLPPKNPKKTRK